MTKKEQKKQSEITAIEQRLRDIARGAVGSGDWYEEDMGVCASMGIKAYMRYVTAIPYAFGIPEDARNEWPFGTHSVERFDKFADAAEMLWDNGVRA